MYNCDPLTNSLNKFFRNNIRAQSLHLVGISGRGRWHQIRNSSSNGPGHFPAKQPTILTKSAHRFCLIVNDLNSIHD